MSIALEERVKKKYQDSIDVDDRSDMKFKEKEFLKIF